jgi:hypothetical protein
MLLYAPDGVGKSTFAAQSPSPIFLGSEDGTNSLDVSRFTGISKWTDIEQAVFELTTEKHSHKTLVIDSLDWIEPLLHKKICEDYNVKTIELAAGGYGKGYVEATNTWIKLKDSLNALREKRGMNIILLAHSEVVAFNDPNAQATYDRYQLKLHKKASALLREFVDCVFFANFETHAKKDGTKTRAFGDSTRVVYTERRPGFDAKNRLGLPFTIPLSWGDYEQAVAESRPGDPGKIRGQIFVMLEEIKDQDLKRKVIETVEKAGDNALQLEAIENRLRIRLEE